MKVQISLFVTLLCILISSVSAEWLQDTPGNNFAAYCSPKGTKVNQVHACYQSDAAVIKNLTANAHFKGYLGPSGTNFVLLPLDASKGGLAVEVPKYTIEFHSEPRGPKGCYVMNIWGREKPRQLWSDQEACGYRLSSWPDFLWD